MKIIWNEKEYRYQLRLEMQRELCDTAMQNVWKVTQEQITSLIIKLSPRKFKTGDRVAYATLLESPLIVIQMDAEGTTGKGYDIAVVRKYLCYDDSKKAHFIIDEKDLVPFKQPETIQ